MKENIKTFPYVKYAHLDSPYKNDKRSVYHAWVNVKNLPPGIPTEVNPREVKSTTKVYKRIVTALTSSDDSFFVNNRGLLISSKNVKVDTLNKNLLLNIGNGSDEENALYGVLDGGHTYHAILKNRDKIEENHEQYVHIEVMTDVDNIDELAAARNTSVQVSDKAIAELASKFTFVKDSISAEPYAEDISYRENESDKRLDSVDFVRLMYCFNIFKFDSDSNNHPTAAYSGKAFVLKDYLTNYEKSDNSYKKIAPLLPKITELYDLIESEMPDAYLEVNRNGRFGRIKGVDSKERKIETKFYKNKVNHLISQGLIFPIIASFRALLADKENILVWEVDPIEVWNSIKTKLVNNTIEMSRQLGNNPQSAGKSTTLWSQNFDAVNTEKLKIQLAGFKNSER